MTTEILHSSSIIWIIVIMTVIPVSCFIRTYIFLGIFRETFFFWRFFSWGFFPGLFHSYYANDVALLFSSTVSLFPKARVEYIIHVTRCSFEKLILIILRLMDGSQRLYYTILEWFTNIWAFVMMGHCCPFVPKEKKKVSLPIALLRRIYLRKHFPISQTNYQLSIQMFTLKWILL